MEDLNPNLQIITLNVNYLNNYKAEVMILNKIPATTLFCQKENHFKHKSRINLKVKVYHTKIKQKKRSVAYINVKPSRFQSYE